MAGYHPGGPPYTSYGLQTPSATPQRFGYGAPASAAPSAMKPLPPSYEQQEQQTMAQTLDIVQRTAVQAVREKEGLLRERDALIREINMLRGVSHGSRRREALFIFIKSAAVRRD